MRFSVVRRLCTLLYAGLIFGAAQISAQSTGPSPEAVEKARLANQQCLACHTEAALKHPPQPGLDLAKLRGFMVDPEAFKSSDHGRLACTKCHNEGYEEYPHAADAKESTGSCADCHSKKAARIEDEFAKSVHAKNMADTFSCNTCHNPHLMRVAAKLADPKKIVAQDNRVCLGCHDSDQTFAKFAPEKKSRPPIDEIHDWLPNTRLHWQSVRCVECHTPLSSDMLSHEILGKDKAEKNCVSCHSVDSSLNARLYRHLAESEQQKHGFLNSVILRDAYVVGATRHPLLDAVIIGLVILTVLGVLIHGLLRFIAARLRGRNRHD